MANKKEFIYVAILDEINIFQGIKRIDAAKLRESDVVVPADCDLKIGAYQWQNTAFYPTPEFLEKVRTEKIKHLTSKHALKQSQRNKHVTA